MAIPARRVAQIKTLAAIRGSGAHSNERHSHHFQIAALELEKSRRVREREVALDRVRSVDARLVEIETALQQHHEALGGAETSGPTSTGNGEPTAASSQKLRTFRY